MIKRIHLIVSDASNSFRELTTLFREAIQGCSVVDFAAEPLVGVLEAPKISSQHLEAIASVFEICLANSDDVICFLPHSSRSLRLHFSEVLNLTYPF